MLKDQIGLLPPSGFGAASMAVLGEATQGSRRRPEAGAELAAVRAVVAGAEGQAQHGVVRALLGRQLHERADYFEGSAVAARRHDEAELVVPKAGRAGGREEVAGDLGGVGGPRGQAELEAWPSCLERQGGGLFPQGQQLGVPELGIGGPRKAARRRIGDEEGTGETARKGGRAIEQI